ncbi:calpain-like cysteine protease [Cavenderia fasciculata]|uniref:Calpain-like cysteine protease n=1 Tax=Cavenderia fasciculata TaxID=261658 RepID=F4Q336_CACFS|nr:calpain-like cysteine protease [Cavenderia fasciculata]EGG16758.1 calpain-like cysteine protease [Cavenderia fasciculata]|eukprot:XP_004355232.1 calpain-like cysteine protease [Cavenderia fasciculata]
MNLEAGEYVVIPSTFDQAIEAAFHLTLFTDDRQATFAPLTDAWKHQELIKGTWVGKSAGGSPNSGESFFKNPQFRLTLPKDRAADTTVLVQLIQDSTLADEGIGFIVINRDQHDKALTAGDFQNEQLFTKTANWERRNDIAHRVVVKQDDPSVFTIIPSTYEKGVNRSFRVQVFSDLPVELDSIDEADDSSDEEEDNNSDKEEKDDNKKQDEN